MPSVNVDSETYFQICFITAKSLMTDEQKKEVTNTLFCFLRITSILPYGSSEKPELDSIHNSLKNRLYHQSMFFPVKQSIQHFKKEDLRHTIRR